MKIKLSLFFVTVLVTCLNTLGQTIYSSEKDVLDSKELVFYGYDFSHFKLADVKKMADGDIKKYVPLWIDFFKDHTREGFLKERFYKEKVTNNFEYTEGLIKSLKESDLVSLTRHTIPADSIQRFIRNYQITEKEGIGFVIFVECFDKPSKVSSAYFTFFDIATKKVLMSDYFGAKEADNYGMVNYWGTGMFATLKLYLGKVYKKKLNPIPK